MGGKNIKLKMRIVKEMYAQTSTNSYIPCEVNRCVVSELFLYFHLCFQNITVEEEEELPIPLLPSTRVTHVGTAGEQRPPKASVSVRPTPPPPLRRMGGGRSFKER